ncbi:hypothetical protein FWP56_23340 [Vibrio vulnificus]|nr:hypothetical protein [Vibrio vulnificus]EJO2021737.1 hypothetical protein [Vibrio vulnificus]ELH9603134.1 hypothetical protein [Vibrio vulnificus]ELH9617471.1 hypothetical protein [Vibrio vulnificus]ELO5517046.1 hypothetical protein [Vibrio vulnificus]
MKMVDVEGLVNTCKKYILDDRNSVVIGEPYIPYIPNNWNGVLVLAESQNLSVGNNDYVQSLCNMSQGERIQRLGYSSEFVGVYPWDDGSIKLAVEAALGANASEVAVSNAVLWSQRGGNDQNVNPDLDLQSLSSELWSELLSILNPKVIICCGKIAQNVVSKSGWEGDKLMFRLPAKTAMSRVSGMFTEKDLLDRYPEVKEVVDSNPSWLNGGYRQNKIFFACHAVSVTPKYNKAFKTDSQRLAFSV